MKKYFFLLLFISCNKYSAFEENLVCKEKKWVYFNSSTNVDSINEMHLLYYIRFGKDLKFYHYLFSDNTLNSFFSSENWSYSQKDSLFFLGKQKEMQFKIHKWTTDTIYMNNFRGFKEYLINIPSPPMTQ